MKTQILTDIKEAASLLLEGEPVAIPTETVYGLAAPVFCPETVRKIFQIKGRPSDNPLIVHISSMSQVETIATDVPYSFYLLAEAFFPGPLTLVVRKKNNVPAIVSADLPTIGIRMPAHPMALKLIDEVKMPLAAPSANLSGKPSSTTVQHVLEDFEGQIKAVLDGGPCLYGLESTVLLIDSVPKILRPGSITQTQIETVLGQKVDLITRQGVKPISPGTKYRHYSPKAKVRLFKTLEELKNHNDSASRKNRRVLTEITPESLYEVFREADRQNVEEISVFLNESIVANPALMNRLLKASESIS